MFQSLAASKVSKIQSLEISKIPKTSFLEKNFGAVANRFLKFGSLNFGCRQDFWIFDTLDFLELWNFGWNFGILKLWNFGTLELWKFEFMFVVRGRLLYQARLVCFGLLLGGGCGVWFCVILAFWAMRYLQYCWWKLQALKRR